MSKHTDEEIYNQIILECELYRARSHRTNRTQHSYAPNTERAYAQAWEAFQAWCSRLQVIKPSLVALPASDETVSLYVGSLNKRSRATVHVAVAAISLAHERAGYLIRSEKRPATVEALAAHAEMQAWQKNYQRNTQSVVTEELIRSMADTCDVATKLGLRNRALLLVGFETALRRSALVGIDIEHLQRHDGKGITVHLPDANNIKHGTRDSLTIRLKPDSPWCPVQALECWLDATKRTSGPVFVALRGSRHCTAPGYQRLSDRTVARIVKKAANHAGAVGQFAGESLRGGMINTI